MFKLIVLIYLNVFLFSGCAHKSLKSLQGHCDKVVSQEDLNACDPYPSK